LQVRKQNKPPVDAFIAWPRSAGRQAHRVPADKGHPNFSATRAWIGTASIHRCSGKRTRDACLPASARALPTLDL